MQSMESRWNDPWNEYGIHVGLGEFSDKVLFHMDSIVIVLILVILVEFVN